MLKNNDPTPSSYFQLSNCTQCSEFSLKISVILRLFSRGGSPHSPASVHLYALDRCRSMQSKTYSRYICTVAPPLTPPLQITEGESFNSKNTWRAEDNMTIIWKTQTFVALGLCVIGSKALKGACKLPSVT